jgi:flagellar hook-length control protein FliK
MPSVVDILSLVAPQAAARAGAPAGGPGAQGDASGFEGVLAGLLNQAVGTAAGPAGKLGLKTLVDQLTGKGEQPGSSADAGSPLAGLQAVLAQILSQAQPTETAKGAQSVQAAVAQAAKSASPEALAKWGARLQSALDRLEAMQPQAGQGEAATATKLIAPGGLAQAARTANSAQPAQAVLDTKASAEALTVTPAVSVRADAKIDADPATSLLARLQKDATAQAQGQETASAETIATTAQAAPATAVAEEAGAAQAAAAALETVATAELPAPTAAPQVEAPAQAAPNAKAKRAAAFESSARTQAAVTPQVKAGGGEHADQVRHGRHADPERARDFDPRDLAQTTSPDAKAEPTAAANDRSASETALARADDRPATLERRAETTAPAATNNAPAAQAESVRTAAAARAAVGAPETIAHLSAQIVKRLEGRSTRFDLELHPADLGRVDVQLRIERDGRVAATIAFDNPVAAADMRARSDDLRRSLEQAGFQLADDGLSFAERDPQNFSGGFSQGGGSDQGASRQGARARAFDQAAVTARVADAADRLQLGRVVGLDVRV